MRENSNTRLLNIQESRHFNRMPPSKGKIPVSWVEHGLPGTGYPQEETSQTGEQEVVS
jgi:hypothetical protein